MSNIRKEFNFVCNAFDIRLQIFTFLDIYNTLLTRVDLCLRHRHPWPRAINGWQLFGRIATKSHPPSQQYATVEAYFQSPKR